MRVVLASSNTAKVSELSDMLKPTGIEILPQSIFGIESCEETAPTFVENALLKARHASQLSNLPAIADDSGLVVAALAGAPGIYSARFAGQGASSADNIAKLLNELSNIPDDKRAACFYCSLVFIKSSKDPIPLICEGRWHGVIAHQSRGSSGFGYDPIFYIPALKQTAAELPRAQKNKISHRGIALQSLLNYVRTNE